MESGLLAQEAGAKVAEMILAAYDRDSGRWSLAKDDPFWSAVASAHSLARRGEGKRIAVVDGGFDMSIAALAGQRVCRATGPGQATAHGTAAALLVHEVAPSAQLELHAVSEGGKLRAELAVEAIDSCVASGVDAINLSLGVALSDDAYRSLLRAKLDLPDDSQLPAPSVNAPASQLWDAALAASRDGVTVVASAGNHQDYTFVPAIVPGVVSVGFHAIRRELKEDLLEVADSEPPTFSQSRRANILLVQPANVLGSSFASPLITGFSALMQDRKELPAYLECVRRATDAAYAMTRIPPSAQSTDEAVLWTESLMKGALEVCPHDHLDGEAPADECPECAVFATSVHNNYGLHALFGGNIALALRLLSAVRRFSPSDAYAAANLGVAFAAAAQRAVTASDVESATALLHRAIEHMGAAVRLRPGYSPYETRLAEFRSAVRFPLIWDMAP